MAISTECLVCGRSYNFSDGKAGSSFRCRDCGSVVEVPLASGRAMPPRSSSRPASRRNARKNKQVVLIVSLVAGFGLLIVLVGVGAIVGMSIAGGGRNADQGIAEGQPGPVDEGIAPADLSDEEKAARNRAYQANLERRRRAQGDQHQELLLSEFGEDKVVTVVFSGVVGDTADADRDLNREVFRAAYNIYKERKDEASQQTKKNKDAAAEKALQEHRKQWGKAGPGFVRFEYKVVHSDLPYPRVVNGGRKGNTFTYLVGPANNPREFAQQIGVGTVSEIKGREIHIEAQLPTPIPDPDVEELVLRYGSDRVVRVDVRDAEGSPGLVKLYLQHGTEARKNGDEKLSVVALKAHGGGRYEFFVGPVDNSQVFAESIRWATPEEVDAESRQVTIAAQLPDHLPTRAEIQAETQAQAA